MKASEAVPEPIDGWQVLTMCAGLDPNLFYPRNKAEEDARAWDAVCNLCPVKLDCLAHGLRRPEYHGVWGGLTEIERDRLVRRLRRGTKTWSTVGVQDDWPDWQPATQETFVTLRRSLFEPATVDAEEQCQEVPVELSA